MRLISGLLLIIAILAAVFWLFAGAMAGVAKVVAFLFLVLFVISLFLKRKHPEEL